LIAIDTSSLRRLLAGEKGADVDAVRDAIENGVAVLPAPVLCEVLSDPALPPAVAEDVAGLPLAIRDDFWQRAGLLRARVLKSGHKAKLADVLIAQSCIDHHVPLVTHDRDFRHFSRFGLKLL
jgi:predicted nucleic acid-binding protein